MPSEPTLIVPQDGIRLRAMPTDEPRAIPTYAISDVAKRLKDRRTIDGVGFDGTADISHYAVCSTGASTAAKTVSVSSFVLSTGSLVSVTFESTNTASNPTLNVSGTGAKSIMRRSANVDPSDLEAGGTYDFRYDGTYWQILGGGPIPDGSIGIDKLNADVLTEEQIRNLFQ